MKIIAFVLLVLLIWLQYKIWLQDGGIPEVVQLQQEIEEVKTEVQQLQERNLSLDAEVKDLKKGLDAIEEQRDPMGPPNKPNIELQKRNKSAGGKGALHHVPASDPHHQDHPGGHKNRVDRLEPKTKTSLGQTGPP